MISEIARRVPAISPGFLNSAMLSCFSSPEIALRRLCDFLELSFEEGMLRHHECVDSLLETVSLPHTHARLRLPLTRGLRNWRTQMTRADRLAFEAVAGGLLAEFGYEPAS